MSENICFSEETRLVFVPYSWSAQSLTSAEVNLDWHCLHSKSYLQRGFSTFRTTLVEEAKYRHWDAREKRKRVTQSECEWRVEYHGKWLLLHSVLIVCWLLHGNAPPYGRPSPPKTKSYLQYACPHREKTLRRSWHSTPAVLPLLMQERCLTFCRVLYWQG